MTGGLPTQDSTLVIRDIGGPKWQVVIRDS